MTNTFSLALKDLDSLLRGDATQPAALQRGNIEIETSRLPWLILALGVIYGACMGSFALATRETSSALLQMLSTMGKVPILFVATLLVTFPSLYVFNALIGSRLTLASVWRLLLSSLAVVMTILCSLGPIVAFFSLSTVNYPFMVLLNVAVFGLSGFLGLKFLLLTLHRLTIVLYETPQNREIVLSESETQALRDAGVENAPETARGALEHTNGATMASSVKQVFGFWIIAFGLVGAQMSWVLRPFIADPTQKFRWVAERESNFFTAVAETLWRVLMGG